MKQYENATPGPYTVRDHGRGSVPYSVMCGDKQISQHEHIWDAKAQQQILNTAWADGRDTILAQRNALAEACKRLLGHIEDARNRKHTSLWANEYVTYRNGRDNRDESSMNMEQNCLLNDDIDYAILSITFAETGES